MNAHTQPATISAAPAMAQLFYAGAIAGRRNALAYKHAHDDCHDDAAKIAALKALVQHAFVAAAIAKLDAKQALNATALKCSNTVWQQAIEMCVMSKKAREKAGTQKLYHASAIVAFGRLEVDAGIRVKKEATGDEAAKPAKKADAEPGHAKPSDAEKLGAAMKGYRPRDFATMERYALVAGTAFGFTVNSNIKVFDKTDTPNRARMIRDAMLAFAKAMRELPND